MSKTVVGLASTLQIEIINHRIIYSLLCFHSSNWASRPNLSLRRAQMNSRKLSSTFLAVTASVALLVPSFVLSKKQHRNQHRLAVDSPNARVADGGAPVPPLPPTKNWSWRNLIADGGAPVPPLPPWKSHANLLSDGGAPVPPLPPLKTNSNLVADGGAPVPPLPPPKHLSQVVLA